MSTTKTRMDNNSRCRTLRNRVVYMRKQEFCDALKEEYDKSGGLWEPKYGWAEFRDWIDRVRILLQHGFGKDSDQECEFMRVEYAPHVDGYMVLEGSPFQSVKSLSWYAEGLTKARLCLANIMDEVVRFCTENLSGTSVPEADVLNPGSSNTSRKLRRCMAIRSSLIAYTIYWWCLDMRCGCRTRGRSLCAATVIRWRTACTAWRTAICSSASLPDNTARRSAMGFRPRILSSYVRSN